MTAVDTYCAELSQRSINGADEDISGIGDRAIARITDGMRSIGSDHAE
jgi:hypothetical protein